tara:strand:+ start:455 stop:1429 length:975 start_codon:yes stop_codon:yes gene_type:complete
MFKLLSIEPSNYSNKARAILTGIVEINEINVDRDQLLSMICDYDVLLVRLAHNIDKEVLDKAKKLKVIVSATTGLNHIDIVAANKLGIDVLSLKNETDFLKTVTSTAEHTWGLILALLRKLPQSVDSVKQGEWERDRFKGEELKGKTIGIVGYGRLGKIVASYAKVFRMKVVINSPDIEDDIDEEFEIRPLDYLLANSDIVTIHVPLNNETRNLIDRNKLKRLKKEAYLINTSRGEVVDEVALLDNLNEEKIAGAALDVLCGETYSQYGDSGWPGNDLLIEYARNNSNLLITPHIGGATIDGMEATEIFMANKLKDYLANQKSD